MSTTQRRLTDPVAIPDHLVTEPMPPARKGNLRCRICRKPISVGDDGTEYGHLRIGRQRAPIDDRCPHRPESVDPNYEGVTPGTAGSDSQHERGEL
ncbi:hypothetical protein [Halobaculum rubrum]|uniref:hypothetical protein n=1 Tax=Halobaculum rubrum TaxID=2872158 RepID=UPI001CA3A74A|nr:hypothetical protein [Halobaculum rubrum]QZX98707.1 hypothetical protein K6T25_10515 [Halobaculum rubrum]